MKKTAKKTSKAKTLKKSEGKGEKERESVIHTTKHTNPVHTLSIEIIPHLQGKWKDKESKSVVDNALQEGIRVLIPLPDPQRKDFTYLGELHLTTEGTGSLTLYARRPNGSAREYFLQKTATLFSRLWRK